ncbi:hypothetical protein PV326_002124 [Microctonus aethiopoides]|nr:hypothetical protein PV326_002124 [Microctonus aethiopoides]
MALGSRGWQHSPQSRDSIRQKHKDELHGDECCAPTMPTVARNWVASELPLDTTVDCASDDVPCVSAGHPVHEMTSWSCIESLFKFLEQRYCNRVKNKNFKVVWEFL